MNKAFCLKSVFVDTFPKLSDVYVKVLIIKFLLYYFLSVFIFL